MIIKVTKFYPKQDRLVILQDPAEAKIGRIIIPDTAKEREFKGTVMEVGPEVRVAAVGDKIMFSKYAGTEIKWYESELGIAPDRDNIYLMIRENDVSGEYRVFEIDDKHIDPTTLKPYLPGKKPAVKKK